MHTFLASIKVKGFAAVIQVDAKTPEAARKKMNTILKEIAHEPIEVGEDDIERI